MTLEESLEKYVDEYLNEIDKKNILMINIRVPAHNGDFFIIDTNRLCILNPVNTLSICFSLRHKTRTGRTLQRKIEETNVFEGFAKSESPNKITYTQLTNNDKRSIKEKILSIISKVYPAQVWTEVNVDIHRVTDWFKIEE